MLDSSLFFFYLADGDPEKIDTIRNLSKNDENGYYFLYLENKKDPGEGVVSPKRNEEVQKGTLYCVDDSLRIHIEEGTPYFIAADEKGDFLTSLNNNQILLNLFLYVLDEERFRTFSKLSNYKSEIFLIQDLYDEYKKSYPDMLLFVDYYFNEESLGKKIDSLKKTNSNCGDIVPEIVETVKKKNHTDIEYYKEEHLKRGIGKRVSVTELSKKEYVEYIKEENEESRLLLKEIFNFGCDFFARRKEQNQILSVLEEIIKTKFGEGVRIWILACGTGEEALYVSAVLDQLISESGLEIDYQIFATDISEEALSYAFMPMFSRDELTDMDINLVENSFEEMRGKYRVKHNIKEKIIFTEQNSLEDSLLTNSDLIICRNFLGDLKESERENIQKTFNLSLSVGGYLILEEDPSYGVNSGYFDNYLEYQNIFVNRLVDSVESEELSDEELIRTMMFQTIPNLGEDFVVIDSRDKIVVSNGSLKNFFYDDEDLLEKNVLESAKDSIKYELEKILGDVKSFETAILEKLPYLNEHDKPVMLHLSVIPLPQSNIVKNMILITFTHPSAAGTEYEGHRKTNIKFR